MKTRDYTTKIKKQLKLTSVLTGLLVVTGVTFFIGAFATEGTRFPLTEYCFVPKQFKNPKSLYNYCQPNKRYRGITWLVAMELETNPDFKKVTILDTYEADRPHTGWLGIFSAAFIFTAYGVWQGMSLTYLNSLHKLIREKEKELIEYALIHENDLSLFAQRENLEKDLLATAQEKRHNQRLYELQEDWERRLAAEEQQKRNKTQELIWEFQNSELQAKIAEEKKKQYEATLAAQKAKVKIKGDVEDPWADDENSKLTKESLREKLKEHEGGWLWELATIRKPLWIVGGQGSWKTNFASSLIMCRYIYNGWKLVSIADPQYHQNGKKDKPWYPLIKLEPEVYGMDEEGNGYHWEGIEEAINSTFKRWSNRSESDSIIQSVWDEVSNYAENVDNAPTFTKRINSDPRKANEAVILLSHGKTGAMTGGSVGSKEARDENSIYLRLSAKNNLTPTFKGKIEGWKNSDGEILDEMPITIPKEWFNPQMIQELL